MRKDDHMSILRIKQTQQNHIKAIHVSTFKLKDLTIAYFVNRHVQKGGLWGLKPLPFFKFIQKCPSQTNNNNIMVNKTKCI